MAPNPAGALVTISSADDKPMTAYELYDGTGRMVHNLTVLNNNNHVIHRKDLSSGLYYVKVYFDGGNLVQKLMFH